MNTRSRTRLSFSTWPAAVYAIGDVHGCLDELLELEARILTDAATIDGEKWLITLGDYIDRGPASPGVIDHLLNPPNDGLKRFHLLGNHEQLLLDFLINPPATVDWLRWGGLKTLTGYGVEVDFANPDAQSPRHYAEALARTMPLQHRQFLETLPVCLSLPGVLFVHAGIRPNIRLEHQDDRDLIWIRSPFLEAKLPKDMRVVHGHTPTPEPTVTPSRIGIDTMCYASGVLTAVRITSADELSFIQTI